jgi:magnesium chelatase family protein
MSTPDAASARNLGLVRLLSGDYFGLDGRPVEVQVDVSPKGNPGFSIVGLPGKSTRESRERIRTAIRNAGFRFPHQDRILVNLAPAFQEKEGAVFDLPVALGILLATGQGLPSVPVPVPVPVPDPGRVAPTLPDLTTFGFLGELGLEGELRPVPGALLTATALRERGVRSLVVPEENADEVSLLPDVAIYAARDIHGALAALTGEHEPHRRPRLPAAGPQRGALDFAQVRGQEGTKRALLVAAAGGHNLLLAGSPGVGKTMLARRFPGILPPLPFEESVEATRIRSATGLCVRGGLVRERPFRAPHHTISYSGLVGGGSVPRPGEVSLAHRGVLFLDELPEFPRKALESLREPLEEGKITIARSSGSTTFPARFILLAAMNPCPCGYLGHPRRACRCSPLQVQSYRQRISGPLLDRIDIRITVGPVGSSEILRREGEGPAGMSSGWMREQVGKALRLAAARWRGEVMNARVSLDRLLADGRVAQGALEAVARVAERRALSVRAFERTLRVARTIADLEPSAALEERHLAEALSYRELPE